MDIHGLAPIDHQRAFRASAVGHRAWKALFPYGTCLSWHAVIAGPSTQGPKRSPELALALPSAYQQDPQELLGMQHALFGSADESYPGRNKRPKSGEAAVS